MRLLLDTHIFIGLSRRTLSSSCPDLYRTIMLNDSECFVSVASVWEIAIKTRLGKLDAGLPPEKIAVFCEVMGLKVLQISAAHATAELDREPEPLDHFDRMLLAQCKVEGLKLVTVDRALAAHPLALPRQF
jgi:PIN domain nuclease of toxin-antitoxin system